MTPKSTKKFLKKSILLQKNLVEFLNWREKKKTDLFLINSLSFSKPNEKNRKNRKVFPNVSSPVNNIFIKNKKFTKKMYRSTQNKLSLDLLKQKQRLLLSDFFPHKKPFMHFWIFPLLGGCFMSLMTFHSGKGFINKNQNFPNLDFSVRNVRNSRENSKQSILQLYKPLKDNNVNLKLLLGPSNSSKVHVSRGLVTMRGPMAPPTPQSFSEIFDSGPERSLRTKLCNVKDEASIGTTTRNQLLTFYANYTNQEPLSSRLRQDYQNIVLNKFLPVEFEKLCLFYLNLTNQNLNMNSNNYLQNKQNYKYFLKQILQQNNYLKNEATFHLVWHVLKVEPNNVFSVQHVNTKNNFLHNLDLRKSFKKGFLDYFPMEHFAQKLYNENATYYLKNSNLKSFLFSNLIKQIKDIPHISYYNASVLLDKWIKTLKLNSITQNPLKSSQISMNNINNLLTKETFSEFCDKLYVLEHLFSNSSKYQNDLTFYFYTLLETLNKNQNNYQYIYSQINPNFKKLESKKIAQLFATVLIDSKKDSTLNSLKNLKKKFQNEYRYHLMKVLLKNSFYKTNSKKNIISPNSFQTFSTMRNEVLGPVGLDFAGANRRAPMGLEGPRAEGPSPRPNGSGGSPRAEGPGGEPPREPKLTFFNISDVQVKRILNYTLFLKFINNKPLLQAKTLPILKKIKLRRKSELLYNFTNLVDPMVISTQKKNLKNITYELLLLQNWKTLFADICYINVLEKNFKYTISSDLSKKFALFKTGAQRGSRPIGSLGLLGAFGPSEALASPMTSEGKASAKQKLIQPKIKKTQELKFLTNKLTKEITLYCKLNTISKKLINSVSSLTDQNQKDNQLNQLVIQYKTPILIAKIQKELLSFPNFNNEFNLLTANPTTTKFKNISWVRSPLSWFEIASKQNDLSNLMFSSQKLWNNFSNSQTTVPILPNGKKINFIKSLIKTNTKKFLTFKNLLSGSTSLSEDTQQPKLWPGGTPRPYGPRSSEKAKTITFLIQKKSKGLKNQPVYFLKSSQTTKFLNKENLFKNFQHKNRRQYKTSDYNFEKRQSEKIFRTYFSVKSFQKPDKDLLHKNNRFKLNSLKSSLNSSNSFHSILPVLKKLKQKVKSQTLYYKLNKDLLRLNSVNDLLLKNHDLRLRNDNFNQKSKMTSHFSNKICLTKCYNAINFNKVLSKQNSLNSKTFLKKFGESFNFFKKADFSLNETEINRLEKKKAVQKKRRLKKLKLENRRRKKRKRFYPRPNYLRFQLYYSFLKKRHLLTRNKIDSKTLEFLIQRGRLSKDKIKNQIASKKSRSKSFQEKIYRHQKQKWGNVSSELLFSEKLFLKKIPLSWTIPTYHDQEFYKISNETLTEFERLCWKSYWLRSNLTPYIRRIQNNFKKMQKKESLKQSKKTFSIILENLLTWPVFWNNENFFKLNNKQVKQMKNLTPAYLNIKETLQNSFFKVSNLTHFKNVENTAEYNRLISERITDEIKNVKSQLNVDGQTHARSYKVGRQKIDKPISKNIWTSLNSFNNNFLEPKIEAFSLSPTRLSDTFAQMSDSFIKPFGDLPTLRLLWAVNKTNLFTYNENNFSRNLWSIYKHREQTKNNKTKKFISQIFNSYNLNAKTVETMSLNKTRLACKKILSFGGFIYEKNYKFYLRNLKYKLQRAPILTSDLVKMSGGKAPANKKNSNSSKILLLNQNKTIFKNLKLQEKNWFESNLNHKSQKRIIHFWWSTRQVNPIEQMFSLWLASPTIFLDLDFYVSENTNSIIERDSLKSINRVSDLKLLVESPNPVFRTETSKILLITSFWVCSLLFHISILFTVIRISEIRSLAKFQFLILYKLTNSYLICLFSISDLFENYKTKITSLIKNTWRFSSKTCNNSSFSQFQELNRKHFEKKWIRQNRLKFIYNKQFMLNQSEKKLSWKDVDILNVQIPNLQNLSNQKAKLENSSLQRCSKFQSKQLIQSTINFHFSFRDFFIFSTKNDKNFSKSKIIENFLIFHSINPSLDKLKLLKKLDLVNSKISQNWFYSWYTGFLWYTFFTSFKNFRSKSQNNSLTKIGSSNMKVNPTSLKLEMFQKKEIYFKKNLMKTLNFSDKLTKFSSKKTLRGFTRPGTKPWTMRSLEAYQSRDPMSREARGGPPQDPTGLAAPNKVKRSFWIVQSSIQLQSILSLLTLYLTKTFIKIFYFCFNLFYGFLFKLIDVLESILLIFYKFLEKPAELMVEWIAEIFLIEWSSDLTTYIPEAFDISIWNSLTKFSRSTRPLGGLLFGFTFQKFFLGSLEIFYSWMLKPDKDLILRQKKGVIFWDIWAEILIQAAEKYKMNLSSLTTLKEEQELLIENLLAEKELLLNRTQLNLFQSRNSIVKETNFFNSETFKKSLIKMTPLMKFLQIYPPNPFWNLLHSSKSSISVVKNNPYKFFVSDNQLLSLSQLKIDTQPSLSLVQKTKSLDSWKRWFVNQSLTTQGRDTDLFMDIHPPKSFLNLSFLKTYLPAQEILGSLVCDIYSGLFAQKISKNILVVGAPGAAKSFFIQALAGETELKIVTDNAHRYALVQGGVPVGMKLLRDVFDSIALHTPCLFLLEDIHVIGERRPMLISDEENSKATDSTFGAEQEEVHEKNRSIYQLSRHSISHYKRPYKGDFSLSIPTNHFCYDLFLGINPLKKRRSGLTAKGPLPIRELEKALMGIESLPSNKQEFISFDENNNTSNSQALLSVLQISTEQVFAPPATSPFNILLMKEQKKLKPKKLVKEMPWSGLSYDKIMLISKSHYSVRVKVALLAEMAMTNLSIKLDMITDLLVIIDSVRSNRGFVVFATTHLPSLLDPALRRPGRLDETISLPLLPNLMSRFEIFKTSLSSYTKATDLLDYSLLSSTIEQNENQIYSAISKSLLLLLNTKKNFNVSSNLLKPKVFSGFFNDFPIYSVSQAFQTSIYLRSLLINTSQIKKYLTQVSKSKFTAIEFKTKKQKSSIYEDNLYNLLNKEVFNFVLSGTDKFNFIALTYAQAGQFLVEALIIHDQSTYSCKFLTQLTKTQDSYNTEEQIFKSLYNSKIESKNTLLKLFAGKIAEFFVLNSSYSQKLKSFNNFSNSFSKNKSKLISLNKNVKVASSSEDDTLFIKSNVALSLKKDWWLHASSLLQTNPSQSSLFENIQNFQMYWQSATAFLDSLFQKRYLYNKSFVVSKMLFFENQSSLREPPSPPNSSILMPAKKFENYKRTLKDFLQKPTLTINEKIQMHQKQRFLKLLYNISIQTSFTTVSSKHSGEHLPNYQTDHQETNFDNSFKELGYLDLMMLKPTASYCFYKNRFLTRHRFSFLNQWWNGQLAEHNVETTYLSHVDWRSMFVQSMGDIVIDFPDADQYYNPKTRRWFLHSTSWNYWLSFENNKKDEISQHYILYCFTKTFHLLNFNRELFDYLAFRFLRYHQLKEIDLLHILSRFYKTKF